MRKALDNCLNKSKQLLYNRLNYSLFYEKIHLLLYLLFHKLLRMIVVFVLYTKIANSNTYWYIYLLT